MQIKQFGIGKDLRELTDHHTALLPMACYQTEIRSHVQGYVPLHWHEEVQFVLIVKGEPPFYELQASCRLTEIWRNLIMNGLEPEYDQAEQLKSVRMKEMLDWIHAHYADKVTLEAIAAAGALSRSECCRYFKRMLKTTPMNYVTDYRLQKSKLMLRQSDLSVTEVAYLNGFSSTSNYIERFRQSAKTTPLAYRKRLKPE
ncbi:hypothetical protein PSTEL_05880 [Paenibacillus stellifer]|uniref:HTH araC/xylS-type domain-containing protein n=1 Tax=Paenibacillus stellifer TaxID=169760 RepID=A0A089LTY9_9BACL|nr:helix-turn-helix domain-containing protein [Paenibacillus stellifer]AIQ62698.1 hypothetical protein PSTEL_05880 [Paenibacillus stellifer]